MERYNKNLGDYGEDLAEKYLIKNRYKILDRNYRCKFGEIDIIALDGECLVFVEVKTRTGNRYGRPSDAINFIKREHLINSAKVYINYKKKNNYIARFDVIEIFIKKDDNIFETECINLIKNAF